MSICFALQENIRRTQGLCSSIKKRKNMCRWIGRLMVVHLPSEPHLLKFAPGAPVSSLTIRPNLQIGGSPLQAVIYLGVKG